MEYNKSDDTTIVDIGYYIRNAADQYNRYKKAL